MTEDAIWNQNLEDVLNRDQPDAVLLNTSYVEVSGIDGPIVMGKVDMLRAFTNE